MLFSYDCRRTPNAALQTKGAARRVEGHRKPPRNLNTTTNKVETRKGKCAGAPHKPARAWTCATEEGGDTKQSTENKEHTRNDGTCKREKSRRGRMMLNALIVSRFWQLCWIISLPSPMYAGCAMPVHLSLSMYAREALQLHLCLLHGCSRFRVSHSRLSDESVSFLSFCRYVFTRFFSCAVHHLRFPRPESLPESAHCSQAVSFCF